MELNDLLQEVQSQVDADAAKAAAQSGKTEELETDPEADVVENDEGNETGEEGANVEKPEGDDDGQDEDAKPKKESRSARLRRQLQALRAENDELKRLRTGADAGKPDPANDAPKFEDFNGDWDRYDAERIKWASRQALREARAEDEQSRSERTRGEFVAALVEEHQERQVEARKALPDYDAVVKKATDPVAAHVAELLLESEKSALLQYHLAQKPEVLRQLNEMSPRDAARQVGRIEARLSLPTKRATNAPPPATTLKGGAKPPSHDADIEAFMTKTYGEGRR